jgi:hypothetical protein
VAERAEARRRAGAYRGTVVLNVDVPGRSPEHRIALVALDAWETCWELRGTATPNAADRFWLPRDWRVQTDAGTMHVTCGGGATDRGWHWRFEPPLPDQARRLRVFVGPDSDRSPFDVQPPAATSLGVDLVGWPAVVRRAAATLDTVDTVAEPSSPPVPSRRGQPDPLLPERVVVVSTQLDDVDGRDLSVLSIDVRRDGFLMHVGGDGDLELDDRVLAVHRRGRWGAEDDRGGRYAGQVVASSSGFPWTTTTAFAPTLDPAATALALGFPNPFGPGTVHTTVAL